MLVAHRPNPIIDLQLKLISKLGVNILEPVSIMMVNVSPYELLFYFSPFPQLKWFLVDGL
jgi:hypothetical protein